MESLPLPQEANLNTTPLTTDHTLTISPHLLHAHLEKRYTTISIPSTYGNLNSSPPPGTVAGIVLGSVGGVVLLLYLTFLALNPGGLARGSTSVIDEEVVVRSRSRHSPSRRSDVIEVVEERDQRDYRRDSYRRPGSGSRRAGTHIVVEESETGTSMTDDPDVVEVIEEESSVMSSISPAPRRGGGGSRRSQSGYRTVNPRSYAGESSYDGDSHYR